MSYQKISIMRLVMSSYLEVSRNVGNDFYQMEIWVHASAFVVSDTSHQIPLTPPYDFSLALPSVVPQYRTSFLQYQ